MRDHLDLGTMVLITGGLSIGYARVSTGSQNLDQQRATLSATGCMRIFEETASGAKRERPEQTRMLDHLRAGDMIAWRDPRATSSRLPIA